MGERMAAAAHGWSVAVPLRYPKRYRTLAPEAYPVWPGCEEGSWLRLAASSERVARIGMQDAARQLSPRGPKRLLCMDAGHAIKSAICSKRCLYGSVLAPCRPLKRHSAGLCRTKIRAGAICTTSATAERSFAAAYRREWGLLPDNVCGAEPSRVCVLPSLQPAADPCGIRVRDRPCVRM